MATLDTWVICDMHLYSTDDDLPERVKLFLNTCCIVPAFDHKDLHTDFRSFQYLQTQWFMKIRQLHLKHFSIRNANNIEIYLYSSLN